MNTGLFRNILKERGLKLSHPRLLIHQELFSAENPLM